MKPKALYCWMCDRYFESEKKYVLHINEEHHPYRRE